MTRVHPYTLCQTQKGIDGGIPFIGDIQNPGETESRSAVWAEAWTLLNGRDSAGNVERLWKWIVVWLHTTVYVLELYI
jgi:hypothetical protein